MTTPPTHDGPCVQSFDGDGVPLGYCVTCYRVTSGAVQTSPPKRAYGAVPSPKHVCADGLRCQPCEQDRSEWWTTEPGRVQPDAHDMAVARLAHEEAVEALREAGFDAAAEYLTVTYLFGDAGPSIASEMSGWICWPDCQHHDGPDHQGVCVVLLPPNLSGVPSDSGAVRGGTAGTGGRVLSCVVCGRPRRRDYDCESCAAAYQYNSQRPLCRCCESPQMGDGHRDAPSAESGASA